MRESIWSYLSLYKLNSIFIKYFSITMLIILTPLMLISMLVYHYYSVDIKNEVMSAHERNLLKNKEIIDIILKEANELSITLAADQQIQQFFSTEQWGAMDYETIDKLQSVVWKTSIQTKDYIDSIYLYSKKNNYVVLSSGELYRINDLRDKQWYDVYHNNITMGKGMFLYFREAIVDSSDISKKYITLFRRIPFIGYEEEGVVVININVEELKHILNNHFEDFYIINDEDIVMYSQNNLNINKTMYDVLDIQNTNIYDTTFIRKTENNNQVIASVSSNFNEYKYVSIIPMDQSSRVLYLEKILIIALIISITLSIVLALIITFTVYQPFKYIISVVNHPDKFESNRKKAPRNKINELKYISNNIMNYYNNKKMTDENLLEQTKKLRKAQSMALQAQINPHFLYNTLHTVSWMSMDLTGGENKVSRVIDNLSKLLRISFQTKEYLIPVEQEIEHVKKYIEIEKVRFSNIFEVNWDIAENILDNMIVKIILQPIVENAICHGIKCKNDKGIISIRHIPDENNLVLQIEDNGVGMSEQQLKKLTTELNKSAIKEDDHIGLCNIHKRIQLIFGENYGIKVESEYLIGTKVKIVVPNIK